MPEDTAERSFIEETDGSCAAVFGPFVLKTALQPLFAREAANRLSIGGVEGLLRIFLNGRQIAPDAFFPRVKGKERLRLDATCRSLHIVNAVRAGLRNTLLFVNLDPGIYLRRLACLDHAEQLAADCGLHSIPCANIVCEIVEADAVDDGRLLFLVRTLRARNFRIALDDYGAEASDAVRYALVKPDIVKLDAAWVRRLLNSASGYSVLRQTVSRLQDDGVTVVVEGLEQDWQVELALESGADLMQGFALARPEIGHEGFAGQFNIAAV